MGTTKRWRGLSVLLVLALLLGLFPAGALAAEDATYTVSGLGDTEYYTVSVSGLTGVNGSYSVPEGGNLTFTVTMQPGYSQSGITVLRDGNEVGTASGKTYTLSNITADTAVTIQSNASDGSWARDRYKVTIPKSGTGFTLASVQVNSETAETGITGSGSYTADVSHGDSVTFALALAEGYTQSLPKVTVGGRELRGERDENDQSRVVYTLEAVTATMTVSISAPAPNQHAVTFPEETVGYTIQGLDGATSAANNGTYRFTVTLLDGYKNSSITVTAHETDNPASQKTVTHSGDGVYAISTVTAPLTIVVSGVVPDQCEVRWTNTAAYTILATDFPAGATSARVAYDDSFTFDVVRNAAWSQADFKVMAGTQALSGTPDEHDPLRVTYTIPRVTGNTTITVSNVTGNAYTVQWVVAGRTFPEPDVPFETRPAFKGSTLKDATAQYSYTFKGWARQAVEDGEAVGAVPSTDYSSYDPAKAPGEDGFYDQSLETPEALPRVTEDVIYHAVYEKTVRTYPVTWTVESAVTIEDVPYGETPSYKVDGQAATPAKAEDSTYTYTFSGWKVNGQGETIEAGNLPQVTEAVNYVAQFTPEAKTYRLTVNFVYDGSATGENKPPLPQAYTQDLTVGSRYALDCTQGSYVLSGYVASPSAVSGTMPAEAVTLTVTYYPGTSTAYTVEHHLQSLDDPEQYDRQDGDTQTLYGATGSDTAASAKYYPGFTALEIAQEQISGSGNSTVIIVKYDRNRHSVTWDAGQGAFPGGTGDQATLVTEHVPYGQAIVPPAQTPTRESDGFYDYTFGGWQGYTDADTMPDHDVAYQAVWNTGNRGYSLTVVYRFPEGYRGSATLPEPYTHSYAAGQSYTVASPAVAGFTPDQSVVRGNMPSEAQSFTVTYVPNTDTPYTVETYLQQADESYEATASHTYAKDSTFGDDDAVTYIGTTGTQTVLTGGEYRYPNYHPDTDKIGGVSNTEITGDGLGVVKLYYARDLFDLTWDANGGALAQSGSYTPAGSLRWGDAITAPTTGEEDPELTRTGYAFAGWEVILNPADGIVTEVPGEMPPAHLTAKALWTANTYTVTFVPGEGAVLKANGAALTGEGGNQLTVTYDAKYGKLPAATLSGKVFQGWFTQASGGSKVTADTLLQTTGDLSLYAQFGDSAPEGGDGTNPGGSTGGNPSGSGGGGGGGGGGAATTPDKNTVTHPDGSVTETVTDEKTGAVTETTKGADGTVTVVVTEKDGASRITRTESGGAKTETGVSPEGVVTGIVTLPKGSHGETVLIPTEGLAPGAVVVIDHEDETGSILISSLVTKNGMLARFDASCKYRIVDNSRTFDDVPAGFWAADALQFVAARGIFQGTSDAAFTPNGPMTRAMLMTVLARLEGQDTAGGELWYSKSMEWAREQGISDGSNPDGRITREQLAAMLYRLAGSPRAEDTELAYADQDRVSDYAAAAMAWAVEQGILNGTGEGLLNPQGNATRAQVATMLMRYVEHVLM